VTGIFPSRFTPAHYACYTVECRWESLPAAFHGGRLPRRRQSCTLAYGFWVIAAMLRK
jgi:hypothetical protein